MTDKQSRPMSMMETVTSTAVGLAINTGANSLLLPMFGFPVRWDQSVALAAIFTVISILRGYTLRRVFEWVRVRAHS